jgi:hypothetical protein
VFVTERSKTRLCGVKRQRNDEPIGVSATGSGFPLVSGYGDLIV